MTREEMRERVALLFRTMYATEADRRMAADAAIAIIRGETLEEAARVADDHVFGGSGVAAAIRALKEGK